MENKPLSRSKRDDYTSVTVWIPKSTHVDIKVHCAKNGQSIQDYLETAIQTTINNEGDN